MALPRTLTTPRLRLEATRPEFADGLWKAAESSLEELRPWMSWAADASLEAILSYTAMSEARWNAGLEWSFTMIEDDAVVGAMSLGRYQADRRCAEMGYWIRSDRSGTGLVSEAGEAVLRFAFDDLELHRVQVLVGAGNEASLRVATKLGFQHEGKLREAVSANGRWHDVYVLGRLATDPTSA